MLACFITAFCQVARGQVNMLSLDECQSKAVENYPLIKQYDLLSATENYTLSNLQKGYLPQVLLNAQASYQSEVTKVPVSIPGFKIPVLDKDQYRATLDVNQLLWDGGAIRAQKNVSRAGTDVEKVANDVSIYAIRDRVEQLYFGVLMLEEQLKQLEIMNADLQNSHQVVEALLKNGTGLASDLDMVKVELLNLEQKKTELLYLKQAQLTVLGIMINEQLSDGVELSRPQVPVVASSIEINRPEISLFEKQRTLFQQQEDLIGAKNLPKLSLFAQGGYGRPGLNMLRNDFALFAQGGVRLSWNFGNLYTRKNERLLLSTNKDLVSVNEETFRFNTNLQLKQAYTEIEKSRELMRQDDEIIDLRQRVKKTGENKYLQGVYTINDYIRDINAENQARRTKVMHEIQYLQKSYSYRTIAGQ